MWGAPRLRRYSSEAFREEDALIAAVSSCLWLLPIAAAAQTQAASTTASNPLAQVDQDFVQAPSLSSSTEIDAGKLASRATTT
jgi:predicted outer membrane protein